MTAPTDDTKPAPAQEPTAMTVLEHIAELRSTLMWAFAMAFLAAIAAWFVSDQIIEILFQPMREAGQETLYFQAPMEGFLLKLKASAVIGLLLVLPLILYKLYSFVLPGLMPKEKRVVTPLLVAATGLFYVGVVFCFMILLPIVMRFAMGFQTETLQAWISANEYFATAAKLCLAFGLLFELPMVVFALSWVGVVDPKTLLKGWRYALLLILMASAILTPPDIISQVLLAGPVMILYLASVLISMLVKRRQRKEKERQRQADLEEERAMREADLAERRAKVAAAKAEKEAQRARDEGDDDDPDDDPDGGSGGPAGPAPAGPAGEGSTGGAPPDDDSTGDPSDDADTDETHDRGAPDPRPAPGAQPRLDEAPEYDEDAPDPPWVRKPRRDGDPGPDDGESN